MFGFCKCGGMLVPEKGVLKCRKCGAANKGPWEMDAKIKHNVEAKGIPIIEDDKPMLPTIEQECSKCGNPTCFFWVIQTRASDEPPTRFFRCTKCNYTWREYS